MGLFSIDIRRFNQELDKSGHKLKGIFCIQYPIYCIHAHILDSTPDPLDKLDKLITDLLSAKPDLTTFQIASLIGTSKNLIQFRIDKLIGENLLVLNNDGASLTAEGSDVFITGSQSRLHKYSYDFYLDGISMKPLPKIFYTQYRTRLISEHDSYFRTNKKGDTKLVQPFAPDLVHTPPNLNILVNHILEVDDVDKDSFSIPQGLKSIEDTSFTKMSIHLLIAVSANSNHLKKEVIDGFAIYSLSDELTYYETLKQHIKIFEEGLKDRINQLQFKIDIQKQAPGSKVERRAILGTNWPEIDLYTNSENQCFLFSNDDLLLAIDQIFGVNNVGPENIINDDKIIQVKINKDILLHSTDRQKLIQNLIRGRDYKFGYLPNNVFIIFLDYKPQDHFVQEVIEYIIALSNYQRKEINNSLLEKLNDGYSTSYRGLLIAGGEYGTLEKSDMDEFMT